MDIASNASFKRYYDKVCKVLARPVCCFSLENNVSLAPSMDLNSRSIARASAGKRFIQTLPNTSSPAPIVTATNRRVIDLRLDNE